MNKGRSVYKTVVTLHDLYPYDCPEVFGYPSVYFNRLFLNSCLKNADGIACVSKTTHSRLQALFSRRELKKSCVIPNIIRQDVVGLTRPMGWPGSPFVLVVAQHRPNKNVELAVKGFVELRNRGIVPADTRLVIVGTTGPSTESIEHEITRLGIERETIFLSAIPEPELQWLYANCSLFLVTSTVEGFCLPLVEALRRSARVVCSDIPSLREVGSDSCEYFALNGFPLQSLVEAASRALVSRHENSSDLERFSSERIGAAYVRFYRDLAAGDRMPEVAVSV
jgi:glycosyltransferase involved in cell wall biosynthesis